MDNKIPKSQSIFMFEFTRKLSGEVDPDFCASGVEITDAANKIEGACPQFVSAEELLDPNQYTVRALEIHSREGQLVSRETCDIPTRDPDDN
jgi:hypothetical protein